MIEVPKMLMIGATGRNSGKTFFAKDVIARYKDTYPIVTLKIVTIHGARGVCQRGEAGCGMCTSIQNGYELFEEVNTFGKKDTMEMLKSGAKRAFLLKSFEDSLLDGFAEFQEKLCESNLQDALILCESNSLRKYLKPGLFVMIHNQKLVIKKSSREVFDLADVVIKSKEVLESGTKVDFTEPSWVGMPA
ncbi:MAG: hypothetical protein LBI43_06295 [Streptococcaceae bacterium]|jgi:hypothetical protein|nr:hypothetical protein [Streptococcaceae bacterium]